MRLSTTQAPYETAPQDRFYRHYYETAGYLGSGLLQASAEIAGGANYLGLEKVAGFRRLPKIGSAVAGKLGMKASHLALGSTFGLGILETGYSYASAFTPRAPGETWRSKWAGASVMPGITGGLTVGFGLATLGGKAVGAAALGGLAAGSIIALAGLAIGGLGVGLGYAAETRRDVISSLGSKLMNRYDWSTTYWDTQRTMTHRQRAVQAIQGSRLNHRSALGNEAFLYHR